MAFSKAPLKRFNELPDSAPPPGTYDPRFQTDLSVSAINKGMTFKRSSTTSLASKDSNRDLLRPSTAVPTSSHAVNSNTRLRTASFQRSNVSLHSDRGRRNISQPATKRIYHAPAFLSPYRKDSSSQTADTDISDSPQKEDASAEQIADLRKALDDEIKRGRELEQESKACKIALQSEVQKHEQAMKQWEETEKSYQGNIQELQTNSGQLETIIGDFQSQHEENEVLRQRVLQMEDEKAQLLMNDKEIRGELAAAKNTIENQRLELLDFQAQFEEAEFLRERVLQMEDEKVELLTNDKQIRDELAETKNAIEDQRHEISESEIKCKVLIEESEKYRSIYEEKVAEIEAEKIRLEDELKNKLKIIHEMQGDKTELQASLESEGVAVERIETQLSEILREYSDLSKEMANKTEEWEKEKAQYSKTIHDQEEKINSMESNLNEFVQRSAKLMDEINEVREFNAKLKDELHRVSENRGMGIFQAEGPQPSELKEETSPIPIEITEMPDENGNVADSESEQRDDTTVSELELEIQIHEDDVELLDPPSPRILQDEAEHPKRETYHPANKTDRKYNNQQILRALEKLTKENSFLKRVISKTKIPNSHESPIQFLTKANDITLDNLASPEDSVANNNNITGESSAVSPGPTGLSNDIRQVVKSLEKTIGRLESEEPESMSPRLSCVNSSLKRSPRSPVSTESSPRAGGQSHRPRYPRRKIPVSIGGPINLAACLLDDVPEEDST